MAAKQPLFDFDEDEPAVLPHVPAHAEGPERLQECGTDQAVPTVREGSIPSQALPEWQEVPAALFLSWSDAMQLAYCARRDEETMLNKYDDVSDWWMDFYAERAVAYRRAVHDEHMR